MRRARGSAAGDALGGYRQHRRHPGIGLRFAGGFPGDAAGLGVAAERDRQWLIAEQSARPHQLPVPRAGGLAPHQRLPVQIARRPQRGQQRRQPGRPAADQLLIPLGSGRAVGLVDRLGGVALLSGRHHPEPPQGGTARFCRIDVALGGRSAGSALVPGLDSLLLLLGGRAHPALLPAHWLGGREPGSSRPQIHHLHRGWQPLHAAGDHRRLLHHRCPNRGVHLRRPHPDVSGGLRQLDPGIAADPFRPQFHLA